MKSNVRILLATVLAFGTIFMSPISLSAKERPDLVIAVDNLWKTMDPVIGISTTGARVHSNVFDTLIRRNRWEDPDGNKLVPWLATSWERTTPTIWTFHLREGVKFHDGHVMDAEDVAFSISEERLWAKKPMAPRGKRYAAGIVRSEATGPLTVEIETATPDPSFAYRLVTPLGFVLPKHYYNEVGTDAFGQKPIGTGPYKIVSFDSAAELVAIAFDDYWKGPAPAASLTYRIVPEFSTRYAGLAAGEFDVIVSIPADQVASVSGTAGIKVMEKSIENYPMFAFNTLDTEETPNNPLKDVNLRKAMVTAIDRDGIVKALWGDATYVPAPFNFPEYGDYYDPNRKAVYTYDPKRAAEFLSKTNYDGEELIWHITRGFYPNYEVAAEFMVEQWREIGINVRMMIVDNFGLAYKRPFHMLNMSMSSEFSGDPYRPLWLDWGPFSSRTRAKHKTWIPSDKFLEIGERFAAAQDFSSRNAAYLDLVAEWEDITPGMYLWRNVVSYGVREDLNWDPGNSAVTIFDSMYLK
ncbi:MAG: ABC transporter substrate-binding protein [Rhodobacterales bacterium]|jgi:peptide/nickel transport system substrate-binding protein|tara:strand:- start:10348 stop:11919 length:1572 start_codon:yes stop_codon:yes gene_type:complete